MTCTLPVWDVCATPATYTAWRPGGIEYWIDLDSVWVDVEEDEAPPPMEMPSMSTPRFAETEMVCETDVWPPSVTWMSSVPPPQLSCGSPRGVHTRMSGLLTMLICGGKGRGGREFEGGDRGGER